MAYNSYFPIGYQPYPYQVPQQAPLQQPMAGGMAQIPQTVQQPQPVQPQGIPAVVGDMIFVNGREEADAWVVQRGQTVHLWDRNNNRFYVKSVGETGMPNPVEVYVYSREGQPEPAQERKEPAQAGFDPANFVSRDEFEKLKLQLEELMAKANANAKPAAGRRKEKADDAEQQ